MRINVARTLPRSSANGPGERFVVWVQGCPLHCEGCWNPGTWAFERRELLGLDELARRVLATEGIEGVTFSGGEPFAQARSLAALAGTVRAAGLSVMIFTGYDLDELTTHDHQALLGVADIVVTGRYREDLRTFDAPWRGSTNQQVHFLTKRYGPHHMAPAPQVEFHVHPDGSIAVTGFPPPGVVTPDTP